MLYLSFAEATVNNSYNLTLLSKENFWYIQSSLIYYKFHKGVWTFDSLNVCKATHFLLA